MWRWEGDRDAVPPGVPLPCVPRHSRVAPSSLINHWLPTRRCRGPQRRETLMSLTISRKKRLS